MARKDASLLNSGSLEQSYFLALPSASAIPGVAIKVMATVDRSYLEVTPRSCVHGHNLGAKM